MLLTAIAALAASDAVPRRFRLTCGSLSIYKGPEITEVALSGGVHLASRDGRTIKSDNGLIRVVSRVVEEGISGAESGIEAGAKAIEKGATPSAAVQPPPIKPEDVKLIELSGRVTLTDAQGVLTADAIFSEDGGRTWRTRGAAKFAGRGKQAGTTFAARTLQFDSKAGTVSGSKGVNISLPAPKDAKSDAGPVSVSAESFGYDLEDRTLTLSGSPRIKSAGAEMSADSITYHAGTGAAHTTGGVAVSFPRQDARVTAASATYSPDGEVRFSGGVQVTRKGGAARLNCESLIYSTSNGSLTAEGRCRLEYPEEDSVFTADRIEWNIDTEAGKAIGSPLLKRGGSSVSGEEILFRRAGNKVVVEVKGGDKTEYVIEPDEFGGLK